MPTIDTLLPAMPSDMLVHIYTYLPIEEQACVDGVSRAWRAGLGDRAGLWAVLESKLRVKHDEAHANVHAALGVEVASKRWNLSTDGADVREKIANIRPAIHAALGVEVLPRSQHLSTEPAPSRNLQRIS